MKLRKLFLGVAIVALMAACGGKTETTTETAAEAPVVETPAEEATTDVVDVTADVVDASADVVATDATADATSDAE